MNTILYEFAKLLKKLHDFIVRNSNHLSDKALHFIVFGFAGILIFVLTYPMFKQFAKMGKSKTMAAIYTLATTVILTITMSFVLDVTQDFIFVPFIFGFMIFLFSHQIFKVLDKKDRTFRMTHYFTATIIIIFAFSLEICQGFTETGNMDVADALFGISGYIIMYYIMYIIITIFKFIFSRKEPESKKDH